MKPLRKTNQISVNNYHKYYKFYNQQHNYIEINYKYCTKFTKRRKITTKCVKLIHVYLKREIKMCVLNI